MKTWEKVLLFAILLSPFFSFSQKLMTGIVADSITMESLVGVHCQSRNHSAVTRTNGMFTIQVNPYDTITFSFVGYGTLHVTVPVDDDVMFVRLRDQSTMLEEVIIRERRLLIPKYIDSPSLNSARPLEAAPGGLNLAYFTKAEKEKRKLVKVLAELQQARLYIEIINEPAIREEIIKRYHLTEERYYQLLANFNQHHQGVMHSNNEGVILNSLHAYFDNATRQK